MVEMGFKQLLKVHQGHIKNNMDILIDDLVKRRDEHDMDKLTNPLIFDVYDRHFAILKTIDYGTDEYYNYEREHFDQAHQLHAQTPHHFYSHRYQGPEPNLIDLLEAIVDIYSSNVQYSNDPSLEYVLGVIKDKGIVETDLEQLVYNTLKLLKEKNE